MLDTKRAPKNYIIFYTASVCLISFIFYSSFFKDKEIKIEEIKISTGALTGVYYPLGKIICRIFKKETNSRCNTTLSDGSVENINRIRNGEANFGIVQSDVFYEYRNDQKLAYIGGLHNEVFTVLIRKDSNITKLQDLRGKKVHFPPKASGSRKTTILILESLGLIDSMEILDENVSGLSPLCNEEVEAMFFVVGHPVEKFNNLSTVCDTPLSFLSLDEKIISTMRSVYPYFNSVIVSVEEYDSSFNSIGTRALLIGSSSIDSNHIRFIKNLLVDNLDIINKHHKALKYLTKTAILLKTPF